MTGRELQVAQLVGAGLSYADIGRRLGISAATVRVHVNAIDREINVAGEGATPYRRVMEWAIRAMQISPPTR